MIFVPLFKEGDKMYKAVIFDLDGTLLDTLTDLYLSVNYALEKHNMPCRTIDEVKAFVGNGVKKLIERAVEEGTDAKKTEQVLESFKEHYAIHSKDNTAPYPGIGKLLCDLESAGIKTGVVSNKLDSATKALCREYFGITTAIGDSSNRRKKPAPDSVLEVLALLGVEVGDAVYVGDSEVDIETARNCNMDCITVTWGFREKSFLKACGATVFADNTALLYELITK